MRFFKMNGIGNDYLFVEDKEVLLKDKTIITKLLCDSHYGVGADGVVYYDKSTIADIKMDIYNKDGSHAEMCGNALRCLITYYTDKNLCNSVSVETKSGLKYGFRTKKGVTVNLGKCREKCTKISNNVQGVFVNMGNPHFVLFDAYAQEKAQIISEDISVFSDKTNVEFVYHQENDDVYVRVFERGVGETLACGTGAAAVFCAVGKDKIKVHLPGGILICEKNDKGEILQTGETAYNFEGNIELW